MLNKHTQKILDNLYTRVNNAVIKGMNITNLMQSDISFSIAKAVLKNNLNNPTIITLDKINNALDAFEDE